VRLATRASVSDQEGVDHVPGAVSAAAEDPAVAVAPE
jgi:hypothetical protein